jgi:hypothetical protein
LELKVLKVLQAQQVLKDQLDHQLRLVIITIYFPGAGDAEVCAGRLSPQSVYSQTAACTVVASIQFYLDLGNCQSSTPDWAGLADYYGCVTNPTVWGELDYDGDNIGNGFMWSF